MQESKKERRKNVLILLVLFILFIISAYPVVKTISGFKYIIQGTDTVTAGDFTAKIYEAGYEDEALVLDHNLIKNPAYFNLHISANDLLFEEAEEDNFTRLYIENTGEITQKVEFKYDLKPYSNASNDLALVEDTQVFFNTRTPITLKPGEKWNVLVGVKTKSDETTDENTGADNAKIGGRAKINITIDISPQ